MEPAFDGIAYDSRNRVAAGKYRGVGMPGKVGEKKGTFTDNVKDKKAYKKGSPPKKI